MGGGEMPSSLGGITKAEEKEGFMVQISTEKLRLVLKISH